jgi:hypothetical protein
MDLQPPFGHAKLLDHVVGDIAHAVSERAGEPPEMRLTRARAAALTVMTFKPGDAVEAMIAGHGVMFHELIVDAVHDTLRGGTEATCRTTRNSVVAMDRAFGNNLTRLERYRGRLAKTSAETNPGDARFEAEITGGVRRHQAGTSAQIQTEPGPPGSAAVTPSAPDAPRDPIPETMPPAARRQPASIRLKQAEWTSPAEQTSRMRPGRRAPPLRWLASIARQGGNSAAGPTSTSIR